MVKGFITLVQIVNVKGLTLDSSVREAEKAIKRARKRDRRTGSLDENNIILWDCELLPDVKRLVDLSYLDKPVDAFVEKSYLRACVKNNPTRKISALYQDETNGFYPLNPKALILIRSQQSTEP